MRPDHVGSGGFDSHTFPPAPRRRCAAAGDPRRAAPGGAARTGLGIAIAALGLLCVVPSKGHAQQWAARRAGAEIAPAAAPAPWPAGPRSATDTIPAPRPAAPVAMPEIPKPPLSPRRAFLYSLAIPGAGQGALDRDLAGGTFMLLEAFALAMVHRSAEDLRQARAFRADSVPLRYVLDPTTGAPQLGVGGLPQVAEWAVSPYSAALIRSRKLHYEDWIATVIFNHLFAGADAWVAAQLWDLPAQVLLRRVPGGAILGATLRLRR